MIHLIEVLKVLERNRIQVSATLSLPIDVRIKSRARVLLDDGREAGLFLPRGSLLRGGDILKSDDGQYVQVIASPQLVSTAVTRDSLMLAKAAYHLGNRHVPIQIEDNFVRYCHDHVLDDMVEQMGLSVRVSEEPFEPEAGAYQQMSHIHDSHEHSHSH